jgi:hypothetical protein
MDAPEGQQSIEALDLVFDALEHAGYLLIPAE